jgi:hypothetical protein
MTDGIEGLPGSLELTPPERSEVSMFVRGTYSEGREAGPAQPAVVLSVGVGSEAYVEGELTLEQSAELRRQLRAAEEEAVESYEIRDELDAAALEEASE